MNILITGGAGFIGSALIRHLHRLGDYRIINVDKLTYAADLHALHTVSGSRDYFFELADIGDNDTIRRILRRHRPDAIVHLAAESHVDRAIADADAFIRTNINGTHTLLAETRRYLDEGAPDAFRFHYVSTDEVFGDLPTHEPPAAEQRPHAPNNPYAAAKAAAEHLVRAWQRTYGLPALISRSSNNFGPYQYPEKLIPRLILNALHGRPLPVYGDGLQRRDWLYVTDHARALHSVLTRGTLGEEYHIGTGQGPDNLSLIRTLCALLEETVPPPTGIRHYSDLIRHVADRPGHDRRYALDSSKIRRELGWQPHWRMEHALQRTVQWYVARFRQRGL